MILFLFYFFQVSQVHASTPYEARGIGGGGAFTGYAMSPYAPFRFVATDMGTLFRSDDRGKSWAPVSHAQMTLGSDLSRETEMGFSSDKKTIYYSDSGKSPKRSLDGGVTWSSISILLGAEERILYFVGSPSQISFVVCGTTDGVLTSKDLGVSWTRVSALEGPARGSVFLTQGQKSFLFHATDHEIWVSRDGNAHFQKWYTFPGPSIRAFTGGSDARGTTLAFLDSDGENACSWAMKARDSNDAQKEDTVKDCGYVWLQKFKDPAQVPPFSKTKKEGGNFIRMAENDSRTLYVTGGNWVRQYGSKIWVSKDAGASWNLSLQLYDWDTHPYRPWPADRLEYSAVGLDVGWDDNAPTSFSVNLLNASEAGSTGFYFLHTTEDLGDHWLAPFTQFADQGSKSKGKRWKSTGLEVTSILKLKFHPKNPQLGYASVADIGGLVTEDGGHSFRISKAKYNTNYDYAFDPTRPDLVYAASGSHHDFPLNLNTPIHEQGGIYVSSNRGRSWSRLTPDSEDYNRQFLSVAYDPIHRILYAGTEGNGIARSKDQGKHWEWMNEGLPPGDRVIPQLVIDPRNGTPYALLTGNAPDFANSDTTGIYRLDTRWQLLRKKLVRPKEIGEEAVLWQFPSSFAIDFSKGGQEVLWLTDIEYKNASLATGAWKSLDQGQIWTRAIQFTHPTSITLNSKTPGEVLVSGLYDMTGSWGRGGAMISKDGGKTFQKNDELPLLANLFNITVDPVQPSNGFFQFFGGGILYGPLTPVHSHLAHR